MATTNTRVCSRSQTPTPGRSKGTKWKEKERKGRQMKVSKMEVEEMEKREGSSSISTPGHVDRESRF
jgi:hypothetical protein